MLSSGPDDHFEPVVAVDAAGNATVAWAVWNASGYAVEVARYVPGQGPEPVEQLRSGIPEGPPDVSIDAAAGGGVVAVWSENPGSAGPEANSSVWSAVYTPGTGWGARVEVDGNSGPFRPGAAVEVDDALGAVAAWMRRDPVADVNELWCANLVPGQGWSAPQRAGPPQLNVDIVSLDVAPDGRALLGWDRANVTLDGMDLPLLRYDPSTGWGPEEAAPADTLAGVQDLRVGLDSAGNAMALWTSFEGYNHLEASRWVAPDTEPPSLDVEAPGGVQTASPAWITGRTEPGAAVTVNGQVVGVRPDGSFEAAVPLSNGTNTVKVVARDASGNEARVDATITYEDATASRLWVALATQNATLLAEMAAQDSSLLGAVAAVNSSLLARMAAENDELASLIQATNATLMAELSAQDDALRAEVEAGDAKLAADLEAARQSASSASMAALAGVLLGGGGLAIAGLSFLRRRKPTPSSA
jgi:hypothetical protein